MKVFTDPEFLGLLVVYGGIFLILLGLKKISKKD